MSDADGGTSSSRSTRRSGGNSPRLSTESPAVSNRRDKSESMSRERSRASSGTPSARVSKEEKYLFTPDYGGNLFTAPRATKRETKRNNRFSPELELQKKPKTAADKLSEAAAAFEEKPKAVKKRAVLNLKDTVDKLRSVSKTTVDFRLPDKFGGKGAELHRRLPKEQWSGPDIPAKKVNRRSSIGPSRPSRQSVPPPSSAISPSTSSSSLAPVTLGAAAGGTAAQHKRFSSIPPGGLKAVMKREPDEEEEVIVRGRRKKKGVEESEKEKEETQNSRSRSKNVRVEEEMHSDEDYTPETAKPVRKGRNSRGSLPPPPPSSSLVPVESSMGRRRKSVAVKNEVMDEESENTKGRRHSLRGETQGVTRTMTREEDVEERTVPSTEASPAPSSIRPTVAAVDRSKRRKRGRLNSPSHVVDSSEQSKREEEPPAKRKNPRRSLRSTVDSEEKGETEETEEVEETQKITTGKHQTRRSTANQRERDEERGEEKGDKTDEEMVTRRRRSFRSEGEETTEGTEGTSTMTTRGTARGNKSSVSRDSNRMKAGKDEQSTSEHADIAPIVVEESKDVSMEEEGEEEEGEEKETEEKTEKASSSMLADEETAEKSGYGEDSSQEYEDTEHDEAEDGGEKKGEEQSTPKRGRGRPRKDGLPCKITTGQPKKKEREVVEPMVRERRSVALNPKMIDYMTEAATKSARRASAGTGITSTPRILAAGGVSLSPPIPEVKAPSGSALSIMRALNKKKLPSIRSPSPPVATRIRSGPVRPLPSATPAEAPPTEETAVAAEEEKKEEEEQPGRSHRCDSTHLPLSRQGSSAAKTDQKDEIVTVVPSSPSLPEPPRRLVEYSSTSSSNASSSQELKPRGPEWITPYNIRGTRMARKVDEEAVTKKVVSRKISEPPVEKKEEKGGKEEEKKEQKEDEKEESGEKEEEKEEKKEGQIEEKGGEEEESGEKEGDDEMKAEESLPTPSTKKEETALDMLARWNESRKAIDEERERSGLPPLPPPSIDDAPSPLASRATRRSINAPARFGDYDLNYGDVRKRSATVASPAVNPISSPPLADSVKKPRRKKEDTASTSKETTDAAPAAPTVAAVVPVEEEQPQPSGSKKRNRAKKEKKRPRLVFKFKLNGGSAAKAAAAAAAVAAAATGEEQKPEGEETPIEDEMLGGEVVATAPSAAAAVVPKPRPAPSTKKQHAIRKDKKRSKKAFAPKWKRTPAPHLGFIELDNKQVESVTLSVASAIDAMLLEICDDGIPKSTLTMKEQASEISRVSSARRRVQGLIGVPLPPGAPRPKPAPIPIIPKEERTKRIRHAPLSKEYDNLAANQFTPLEQVDTSSFQALAGLMDRKPAERRRESRQEKKLSIVAFDEPIEAEAPVEKPKKQRKKEKEKEEEEIANENAITYAELVRQKTHNNDRQPGRVINDSAEFFYREIFTDDVSEGIVDRTQSDVDVVEFSDPVADEDLSSLGPSVTIGVLASDAALKLLAVLPRPLPYRDDEEDSDEDREWAEDDMKRALSHSSPDRKEMMEKTLRIINSQRMADLAVEGTKGAQDVLHNSYVKHACQLRDILPIFSQSRLSDACWLHRSMIRLLPSYLLPVYLEIIRFIRYLEPKGLTTALSKGLAERGVDADWDILFQEEVSEDDRTMPMLYGSESASAVNSDHSIGRLIDMEDDVVASMEDILKAIEQKEKESAAAAAAAAEGATSPDSDAGRLVIDEETEEDKQAAVDAATPVEDAADAAPSQPKVVHLGEIYLEEEVFVEDTRKPSLESVTEIMSEVTEKRVREANADTILNSLNTLDLRNVIPILIAPVFDIEDAPEEFTLKNKAYEYMFRLIRYATPSPGEFKPIRPRIPTGECSIAEAMDAAIEHVVTAVKAAVKNKGNYKVVLFGWGISCYINHRVAQLIHGISAIVNFAFPLKTLDGWRGRTDDDICLTYCPSLFVMGAEAEDFDPYELLMMRQNMIQPAGVIVIGSADAQLNISTLRLSRERITQKIAARMILEQVIRFINMPANQLERAKLVPLQLNNVYFVEPIAVKPGEAHLGLGGSAKKSVTYSPIESGPISAGSHQSIERRRIQQQKEEKRRKRNRVEDQTTAAGRLAQSIASSAAPITKRARTDDLPSSQYGARIGEFRFSAPVPSPLASPSLHSPGFRMMNRPAILSHSYHHPAPLFAVGGVPSTSTAPSSSSSSSSGLLLQTATTRPANAATVPSAPTPSPRGNVLDPASISLS